MERFKDERTPEQRKTHTVLVGGRDTFMSGWGPCENGGKSYAFWACRPEDSNRVWEWVASRTEFRNIRRRSSDYRPQLRENDRCHVYVVTPEHRALQGDA